MSKKNEVNYEDKKLLLGRNVVVGLKGGTNLSGEVRSLTDTTIVLVMAPRSSLEIETEIVHTMVSLANVDFVQFKTPRE